MGDAMKRKIRYDQRYHTLMVVHNLKSYSAAGTILSLTPSAIAHQIHSLEQELKIDLFTKAGNKLVPTRECDLIAEFCEKIQMLCQRMEADLNGQKALPLTIGTTPSVECGPFLQILSSRQEDFCGQQLKIITESASALYDMLINGAIDLAIAEGDFKKDDLNSILLDTDHLIVAVSNDSPYAAKGIITVNELQKERLILQLQDSGTHNLFAANLQQIGVPLDTFHVIMEIESVATIKKLVAENYGVSILSHNACAKDAADGKFRTIPLHNVNMVRNIHVFYRKDFQHGEVIRKIQKLY